MTLLEPADALGSAEEAALPLDSDGGGLATTQGETPPRDGDLILKMDTPADSDPILEIDTPADSDLILEIDTSVDSDPRPPEIVAALEADEPLDPALEELFREANAEAEEGATVSELPDIPIRELLNELVALGRSLGIDPAAHAESANGAQASSEPERPPILEDLPSTRETGWVPPSFSRRHALHSMLLSLTFVVAIATVLVGADRIVSNGHNQGSQLPAVATATPGVAVRQVQSNGHAVVPTSEAAPTPTSTRQPAYFLYTVQRGDTLTAIAKSFGISLDHILWTNPDAIDDPDVLMVGDKLLIPNVAGIIYYVEPGDVLSAIGHLLPSTVPDDSGTPPGQTSPP